MGHEAHFGPHWPLNQEDTKSVFSPIGSASCMSFLENTWSKLDCCEMHKSAKLSPQK